MFSNTLVSPSPQFLEYPLFSSRFLEFLLFSFPRSRIRAFLSFGLEYLIVTCAELISGKCCRSVVRLVQVSQLNVCVVAYNLRMNIPWSNLIPISLIDIHVHNYSIISFTMAWLMIFHYNATLTCLYYNSLQTWYPSLHIQSPHTPTTPIPCHQ